jgi:hypothetical protein
MFPFFARFGTFCIITKKSISVKKNKRFVLLKSTGHKEQKVIEANDF